MKNKGDIVAVPFYSSKTFCATPADDRIGKEKR
jgi:hypothetical protein